MPRDIEKLAQVPLHFEVSRNSHKVSYMGVRQWLETFEYIDDIQPDDLAEMERTDVMWSVRWYPTTPVGFCITFGPTLDRALELAEKEGVAGGS